MGSPILTFKNTAFCFHKKMEKKLPVLRAGGGSKIILIFSSLIIVVAAKEESNFTNCIAAVGQELCLYVFLPKSTMWPSTKILWAAAEPNL